MVKIPEKPPVWPNINGKDIEIYFRLGYREDIKKIVRKVNKDYLYWDNVKYCELPEDIRPEEFWSILKQTRTVQLKRTPVKDNEQNFFLLH